MVIVIAVNSSDGDTSQTSKDAVSTNQQNSEANSKGAPFNLLSLTSMSKKDVVGKLGKPSMVIYDDNTEYNYMYSYSNDALVLMVMGDKEGAITISLVANTVNAQTSSKYEVLGIKIGDSFDKTTDRLGKAEAFTNSPSGDKSVFYKTKEGYSYSITAKMDSDLIHGLMFTKDDDLSDVIE